MRILVVEDDAAISALLQRGLSDHGHVVDVEVDGASALWAATERSYDAVVLDVEIPEPDGLEVCRQLRSRQVWTPIVLLTGLGATADRVHGLDSGADDYLAKPFEIDELLARLRAVVRRGAPERPSVIQLAGIRLDPAGRQVARDEVRVELRPKEFALLELLLRHPGQILTRDTILERVWDLTYDGSSNVLDVTVRNLRERIDRPFNRASIETVRGVGYRLNPAQ